MKRRILIFSMALGSMFYFVNCKSDDDKTKKEPVVIKNNMELISENAWLITSVMQEGHDLFTVYDSCRMDNEYSFGADYILRVAEGANVCSPSYAGKSSWGFVGDSTRVRIEKDTLDVLNLTGKELKLSSKAGTKARVTTYVPKPEK